MTLELHERQEMLDYSINPPKKAIIGQKHGFTLTKKSSYFLLLFVSYNLHQCTYHESNSAY